MRRGEEDDEEERPARLEAAHRANRVAREHRRVGRIVHLAHHGERGTTDARVEEGHERGLALEGALADELAEVELGHVDRAEAEIDAREDVARVVADDAGRVAGAREALGKRVEVAGALLPAREHRADAVVVRVAPREQRDPRGEGARERDVRAVEARAARRRGP